MLLSNALIHLFPGIDFITECSLQDDGTGPYIAAWNRPEPQPTQAEIDAAILPAKRAQIIEQINAERDRRTTLGVPYVWPDGLSGSIQTRHQDDIMNMTGQVLTATLLTMQGVTDPVLWFIDANNVRHDMTPAQMITAGFAMQAHLSSIIDAARTLKDQVLLSDDPESIVWPE